MLLQPCMCFSARVACHHVNTLAWRDFQHILNLSVPLLQEKLMSERNSIIASNNNRHARERAALERQQEKLHVRAGQQSL